MNLFWFCLIFSPILFWKHLVMQKLLETITPGGRIFIYNAPFSHHNFMHTYIFILCCVLAVATVVSVSLWRFSLIRAGESLELL